MNRHRLFCAVMRANLTGDEVIIESPDERVRIDPATDTITRTKKEIDP